jgi:DNA primase
VLLVDVEQLLKRLGIVAKRNGREWTALCPNHDDKNPSWRIRDEQGSRKHGFFHCYPCGFSGGPINLVMAMLKLNFRDAKAWLHGADVASNSPIAESVELQVGSTKTTFSLPAGVTIRPMPEWPTTMRQYAESRGITPGQVERWGIGYAVAGRLAGRLVIPKRDRTGQVRGYSARSCVGSKRKYLEPEAWEGASPYVVFGEEHWVSDTVNATLWIAEGALNALALERAIPNHPCVGATSGSTLHPMVAAKMSCFARLIVVTDPDDAGDKLAANILSTQARHGRIFERIRLPIDTDAQSIGDVHLKQIIESRTHA